MRRVTANVYVETNSRGCNFSWVVTQEGVVVIDTPLVPSDAVKWREDITSYGPIRYVINSEPHMDHFSGNRFLGGTIISHEGTRESILKASLEQLQEMLKRIAPESPLPPKDFIFRPPDITFSQSLNLYLGKHTFKLINMPGHTPYQLVIYVPEEKVLFTSDNVVYRVQPYLHQALPYAWLDTLEQMQQFEAEIFVPGHGNVCDRNCLQEMSTVIQTWINAINKALDEDLTLEEAQKHISMIDRFPYLDQNPRTKVVENMNITHLYDVLKKK